MGSSPKRRKAEIIIDHAKGAPEAPFAHLDAGCPGVIELDAREEMDEDDKNKTEEAPLETSEREADGAAYTADSVSIVQRGWTYPDNPGGSATQRRILARHRSEIRNESGDDAPADPFRIRIYDPADLHRAIREITGDGDHDECDDDGPEDERPCDTEANLSNDETLRVRRLRQVANDRRGPWRSLIRGTPDMVQRLESLKTQAAHFAPFIDLVARAVAVAIATDTPLRLPPILLVGDPGIGKTYVLKRIAAAIGTSAHVLAMNMTDSFRIRGLNGAWKGARMGKVAELLLAADTASPIVLLDELEKTPGLDRLDRPFDVWHSLFEVENAATFTDDYLEVSLRCDRILWIASANSVEPLPASIIDRLLVLRIPPPDSDQVLAIIDGLYAAMRETLGGGAIADKLEPDVREALAQHTPRRAGRVLDLAFGFMAADQRLSLSIEDVERAARLAEAARDRTAFGFVPCRP